MPPISFTTSWPSPAALPLFEGRPHGLAADLDRDRTASTLAELALHGLPDNWYASYAANLRKVTAKDVKAVAKSVIPSKRMAVSVVGDMTKVRADIDKLGLGDAAMFDLCGVPLAEPPPAPAPAPTK